MYPLWKAIVSGVVIALVALVGMAASGGLKGRGVAGVVVAALVLGVVFGIGIGSIQHVV